MDPTIEVNERVDVVTVFRKYGNIASLCLPIRMRWGNRDIEFNEFALRHPTHQGTRMIHVFHVSDGANGYRLEFDAEALTWMLVSTITDLGEAG